MIILNGYLKNKMDEEMFNMGNAIKLKPAIKDYIWGGTYFKKYNKGDTDIIAECWELSVRDDFNCVLADSNKPLKEILTKDMLGPNCDRFPYFPLLIKLIDAYDNLSVQVHPSDDYALKNEHSFGKSEMWHIIGVDEGAGLYVGFKKDCSKEEVKQSLKDGSILNLLNLFKVKPGETYIINPGTIHAIGKGVRLIEIQQNSDLTYRLYDYNRVGKDGNPRPLHIEKALNVINFKKYEPVQPTNGVLGSNQYFHVVKKEFDGELEVSANEGSFVSFTFIEGQGLVDDIPFNVYDTFFLPNGKSCKVKGKGIVILSRV